MVTKDKIQKDKNIP